MKKLVIFSLLLCEFALQAHAQPFLVDHDSLAIVKKRRLQNIYKFQDDGQGVTLRFARPQAQSHLQSGFLGGALTLLTGLGTGGTQEDILWMVPQKLWTGSDRFDWDVQLFAKGALEKDRSRTRNADGTFSLESRKTITLDWSSSPTGILLERNFRIAQFDIVHIDSDTLVKWRDRMMEHWLSSSSRAAGEAGLEFQNHFALGSYGDYALVGKFREKELLVLFVGVQWRTLICLDGKPLAIFQSDNDPARTSKKDPKISPYLIIDREASAHERNDLKRLALVSRVIAHSLSRDVYVK